MMNSRFADGTLRRLIHQPRAWRCAEGVHRDVLVALVREEPLPAGAVGRLGGVLRHERVEVGLGRYASGTAV